MKSEIDDDMWDFFVYMKWEKEVVDVLDIEMFGEEIDLEIGEFIFDEDKGYLCDLNYIQEQKFWVELMFIQLDKFMVWIGGLIVKEDLVKYWMCKVKFEEDDYEVVLIVVFINKYYVKFSLEFVLVFLFLGKYGMMAIKVQVDIWAKKKVVVEVVKKQ